MNGSPTTAYVLLGSNHDALANFRAALIRLRQQASVEAVSSIYRSPAAGSAAGGEPYLNAAVKLTVAGTPEAFKLDVLRAIESALGRRRDSGANPREVPLDLDLVLWGDTPITYGSKPWRSPSPDILEHGFVALPLAEIAPNLRHPETGERLNDIARRFAAAPVENLGHLLD